MLYIDTLVGFYSSYLTVIKALLLGRKDFFKGMTYSITKANPAQVEYSA